MFSISAGFNRLVSELNALPGQLEIARERALDRAAKVLLDGKVREMGQTYKRPVRRLASGRPAWTRSGDWLNGQQTMREPGVRIIRTTGKAEAYEGRLAALPTGPDGINRSNPASDRAVAKHEAQAVAVFEQELINGLNF